jgi:hypothetical protein
MKFKTIALLIGLLVVLTISLWIINEEINYSNIKKAHSLMTYNTMDLYQMMNDSSLFQIEAVFHDESGRCMFKGGNDYIVTQVIFDNENYVVCFVKTSTWERAWDYSHDWNRHAESTNWAFGMKMLSFGDVLVQVNPIDDIFLREFASLAYEEQN